MGEYATQVLINYRKFRRWTKTKDGKYPLEIADKYVSITKNNQHIKSFKRVGSHGFSKMIDFDSFYANIMVKNLLPYGNIKSTPWDGYENACFYGVKFPNGEINYVWDIMFKLYHNQEKYQIVSKHYMKLGNLYQKLGEKVLEQIRIHPEKKKELMIFGCFFYGRKQGNKFVQNFFAGSYMYAIGANVMDSLVVYLKSLGAKILNTATDAILYTGLKHITINSWKGYSLKQSEYSHLEYRGLNNWTGYDINGGITEKHQCDFFVKSGKIKGSKWETEK